MTHILNRLKIELKAGCNEVEAVRGPNRETFFNKWTQEQRDEYILY